ncbi:nucleotide-binding universal stress UspA family protein [Amycolatopsis sulphurea]|uniref:Nucleotide-binding universal stress UspA family protein n=1 Tax=Amycolatopsis sulphurea TaxID=76022 RepID=A0A2A9G2Q1_9PSEU|nr:universal stress protein [Amycolatopsis sulphurea]PFG57216.1 nucleotide-binding universal stress UspA family protein [Amycolatopsis sulphurea]
MSEGDRGVVLAGVDGSASARHAVVWAAEQAARRSLVLRLVQVYVVPSPGITGPGVRGVRSGFRHQARAWLAEAEAAVLQRWPSLPTERLVAEGSPVAVLRRESRGAELAVLGSRGLGGFTGLLVGSTAVGLVAHARCPVVVVRGRMPDDPPPAAGPVVAGLDGSADSDDALGFACAEAVSRHEVLLAVHTWNEQWHADGSARGANRVPGEVAAAECRRVEDQLAPWREKFPQLRIDVRAGPGRPVRTLLKFGEDAQLVVVGSRGRGGFDGMLLGSTSQALLVHSACPVAVVRPGNRP